MKKIKINGTIISNELKPFYDEFGIEATCPKDVLDALGDEQDVQIQINSGGGHVNAGQEIYHELTQRIGHVEVDVIWAGSAASVIAMAGDTVRMSPVGQIMIHNASTWAAGDSNAMKHTAEVLTKTNESIAAAYQIKTGKSVEELLDLMNHETWLTAQDALDYGFVDEIIQRQPPVELVANATAEIIPKKVIDAIRAEKQKEQIEQNTKKTESPFERFLF
ncbi:head maturation protease, ClpP-related [Aerococcus kribbianus]|uniref:ATP-dependent Clp protease proteolytic subunit n=1 Tax=Aerococcus kribbianus TaxID=2999064 RepID=A0A9X3FVT1_9LACT|nr:MULTISPECIES: head maturation protease, ClpP-related [unclassified Aerococcus]MCZ0717837.1 Clp protease ClpP [Aerococcus sp. YH-aer221]MCZ0726124.1 Clp protease ClpP [Aerococcus sp. YH-aer222]